MKASEKSIIKMTKFLHEANTDMNVCGRNGTMLHFAVLNDHTEVLKVTLNQYVNTAFAFCTDLVGQAKATFTLTSTLVNVCPLVFSISLLRVIGTIFDLCCGCTAWMWIVAISSIVLHLYCVLDIGVELSAVVR